MHSVVLVKLGVLVDLAHQNDDGGDAIEEGIAGALVGLPGIVKVRDALLEDLAVDFDVCHDERRHSGARLKMAETIKTAEVCVWAKLCFFARGCLLWY